jgi:nucleoside phosphorylase
VTLIAAALWAESLPIGLAMDQRRMLGRRVVLGKVHGQDVVLLRCGVGLAKAQAEGERILSQLPIIRVISVGTCGSLCSDLSVGQLITASSVCHSISGVVRPAQPISGVRAVPLVSVADPVFTRARRAFLAPTAAVCEMEAAALQLCAGARPFSALKVVSDLAGAEDDTAFSPGDPSAFLRFQRRAAELVHRVLLPPLLQALRPDLDP